MRILLALTLLVASQGLAREPAPWERDFLQTHEEVRKLWRSVNIKGYESIDLQMLRDFQFRSASLMDEMLACTGINVKKFLAAYRKASFCSQKLQNQKIREELKSLRLDIGAYLASTTLPENSEGSPFKPLFARMDPLDLEAIFPQTTLFTEILFETIAQVPAFYGVDDSYWEKVGVEGWRNWVAPQIKKMINAYKILSYAPKTSCKYWGFFPVKSYELIHGVYGWDRPHLSSAFPEQDELKRNEDKAALRHTGACMKAALAFDSYRAARPAPNVSFYRKLVERIP